MIAPDLIVRIARKAWTCKGCGTPIAKGEKHLEYVGEVSAYSSGSRYCQACADIVWLVDPADFR